MMVCERRYVVVKTEGDHVFYIGSSGTTETLDVALAFDERTADTIARALRKEGGKNWTILMV